jgi:hypothetical protein
MNTEIFLQEIKDDIFKFRNDFNILELSGDNDKYFKKYIFNCPSKDVSKLSRNFAYYGISKANGFKKFIREIQKILDVKSINYIWSKEHIESEIYNNFIKSYRNKESFVFLYKENRRDHLDTFFKKIRNGLVHGTFMINRDFILIYNVNSNNKVTAVFFLSIQNFYLIFNTLENWKKE